MVQQPTQVMQAPPMTTQLVSQPVQQSVVQAPVMTSTRTVEEPFSTQMQPTGYQMFMSSSTPPMPTSTNMASMPPPMYYSQGPSYSSLPTGAVASSMAPLPPPSQRVY